VFFVQARAERCLDGVEEALGFALVQRQRLVDGGEELEGAQHPAFLHLVRRLSFVVRLVVVN
jgi:hypothetical protein